MEDPESPRHRNDTTVPSVAAFMTATERRSHGGDGSQPERGGGHPGVGRAGTQPARPGVRGAADRGNRLRESSGVSERADGEGAEDHHQLLHRQPGGGRSDARRARPAALRLLRGEDIKHTVCGDGTRERAESRALGSLHWVFILSNLFSLLFSLGWFVENIPINK